MTSHHREPAPAPGPGDRCPGVLRTFPAADGGIARLRFPGGRLRPGDWAALAGIATDHGGDVHLTSRGNVQIRGIRDEPLLQERVGTAGLLPSPDHDRVRNIIASPLAGRLDGHHDLGDLPEQVDAALLASRDATGLSGRFLFGLDDGSGDVLAHSPDLTAVAGAGAARGALRVHVAGRDAGVDVPARDIATVLVDVAAEFARRSGGAWRIPGSGGVHDLVVVALADHPHSAPGPPGTAPGPGTGVGPRVGWIDTADGLVTLLGVVPFGVVSARLAEFLGAVDRPSTISADRVIGLHGLTEGMAEQVVRVLAPMGMVFDAASPWVEVTACTGLPGCSRSLTDVRYDAADAVRTGTLPVAGPQHWVGCDRACGDTGRGERVTATPAGYRVGRPRRTD
ncbi:MAG TPA: precorrin-3B synthase [Candidatus Dietzia intestinipullorum]|nr:precorrin-3B synthase [Candidatus Dietzia intestinipullorum]